MLSFLRHATGEYFFHAKVRPALKFLEHELKNRASGSTALSFNGGKDSTALLELLEVSGLLHRHEVRIVNFREDDCFPELQEFIQHRLKPLESRVFWRSSDMKAEMTELVTHHSLKCVILGQRATDPHCPPTITTSSTEGWPIFTRLCPLRDWKYGDIWHFLLSTNSQYCELYNQGYTSLGPRSQTQPNSVLQGRPAYFLKDEAGERIGRCTLSQ